MEEGTAVEAGWGVWSDEEELCQIEQFLQEQTGTLLNGDKSQISHYSVFFPALKQLLSAGEKENLVSEAVVQYRGFIQHLTTVFSSSSIICMQQELRLVSTAV